MVKPEFPKEIFAHHEIRTICCTDEVQRFFFKKPGTGTYSFHLTCADNLLAMTGDCYSLFLEPGYGRPGLGFLLGSVQSPGYFLSKVRVGRDDLREYKREYAIEDIEEWVTHEYITAHQFETFKEELSHETGNYGHMQYYELCNEMGLEEPPSATRMHPQVRLQLAGLMSFVEKFKLLTSAQNQIGVPNENL